MGGVKVVLLSYDVGELGECVEHARGTVDGTGIDACSLCFTHFERAVTVP